jgi:sec-independent protein translocase protein TatA
MWRPGGWEIIAILVVVLILFGPKQLPKLGKMFGRTMKDLKEGMEAKDEDEVPKEITEAKSDAAADEAKKPEDSAV